ncbi:hypothetical protein [Bizionia myxarmorum]|uniref:Lipoprotein n=1 Tax=Bizionia myxarmorum TaxID=291186 RepID=A0A5D0R7S6_9FLAO|nr:hypothetical protein [Bizionia myxarmorum]TYB76931.1 hypothetical protein ES674_09515 [Bizionia myxarmorum]
MNFKTYTLAFLTLLVISCKGKTEKDITTSNFTNTFTGKMDGENPLLLKLKADNGILTGTYFYNNLGKNMDVKGTISKDSTIILNELDNNGTQTGLWKAKLINQNEMSGTWSKPNGDSAKNFTLNTTSETFEAAKQSMLDTKYANYNGSYNGPYNEDGMATGKLILKYLGNQEMDFDITIGNESGCTGKLMGVAEIDAYGSAIYTGSGCESLNFEFRNGEIDVIEDNCNADGMNCYFSGTYKK